MTRPAATTDDTRAAPIVVVVNDPAAADSTLAWSLVEAEHRGCGLTVMYVPDFGGSTPLGASDDALLGQGQKELSAARERLGRPDDPRLHPLVRPGTSPLELRQDALAMAAPMVVVGPTGRAALAELVFGPLESSRNQHGDLPIVVVPAGTRAACLLPPLKPTITVGFHGSEHALVALRWALDEAGFHDADLTTLLVWWEDPMAEIAGSVGVSPGFSGMPGRTACGLAAAALEASGIESDRITPLARRGIPTDVLVKQAAASDLLVVGAGHSIVHHHRVLGTTTTGCVQHSPVPVAIISKQHTAGR